MSAMTKGQQAQRQAKTKQSTLTVQQRISWGDPLELRGRQDEHLVMVGNIAPLPENAGSLCHEIRGKFALLVAII